MDQEPASVAPLRLLVIDDEPAVLKLVQTMLQRAKYDVVTAGNANQGLQILNRESETPIDCVITDAMMPGMSGYEVVQLLRKHPRYSSIPILMLTRKRNPQDVKKAIEAGVNDYVIKPIDETLLLDKVELCLKKNGIQRHVFECAIHDSTGAAAVEIPTRITTVSESGFSMCLPFPLGENGDIRVLKYTVSTRLFAEMGIPIPQLTLVKCSRMESEETADCGYEAKFAFVGLTEADLKKIRNWLQRYAIQRRK